MSNKTNMFWTVYKKLEKDVIELSYFIRFSDEEREDKDKHKHNQIWTYSNQIADLLIAICTQIESLFFELYKQEFEETADSIGTAISKIDKKWNFSAKQVRIIAKNMYFSDMNGLGREFAPMSYRAHDENDYYGAYCAVKHNRINTLYKANINILIRALAALFILNVYYSFEDVQINELNEFDYTMGSDVFWAKTSVNGCSENDILIVSEDAEYLNKLTAYAGSIPDFSSGTFLKFKDEKSEPKRYIVKTNK